MENLAVLELPLLPPLPPASSWLLFHSLLAMGVHCTESNSCSVLTTRGSGELQAGQPNVCAELQEALGMGPPLGAGPRSCNLES